MNNHYGVGIGASGGGLAALSEFFQSLPPKTGPAYFVVTHLLRDIKSDLDISLESLTQMPVVKVTERTAVAPNTVYVLAENQTLLLDGPYVFVEQRKEADRLNQSVDIFFASLAAAYADRAVAIVLSGNGMDGSEGVKKVKENKGTVFVQSPESSQFEGMPTAAIISDHPLAITYPAALANELVAYLNQFKS